MECHTANERRDRLPLDFEPVGRYALALVLSALAVMVRYLLHSTMGESTLYLLSTLAVMVAALYGGRVAGLTALLASVIGIYWLFLAPHFSLLVSDTAALAGLLLFTVIGIIGSVLIGGLRESHLRVAGSERLLRRQAQLIEFSYDAIITTGPDRVISGWNAGAAEMYGWSTPEAKGRLLHQLLHTRAPVSIAEIDRLLNENGHWDGELVHSTKDGRTITVETRQFLNRDPQGNPIGVLEINRDVTDRKHAEAALRASEERYRSLFEHSLDAVFLTAPALRIAAANAAACALFGMTEAQICAKGWDGLIAPDDSSHWRLLEQRRLSGRVRGEATYRRADGTRFSAEISSVAYREDRTFLIMRDITERRQAEERLREFQKLESVGLLAAGVAHDFNNLLTVVMGNASMCVSGRSCENARAVVTAANQAADLTRQLMAYGGKGHFVVEILDLTRIVSERKELLLTCVPKKVSIEYALSEGLPFIEADRSRIEQVLMNLVINAGEAISPHAGGRIHVSTKSALITDDMARKQSGYLDVKPGTYVCLEVSDNGSGMDPGVLARVFDPFFSTKFTGRGLGLAAVQGIVRSARGFIEVDSLQGRGSAFRIFLPAAAQKCLPARVPVRTLFEGTRDTSKVTLLVVEDETLVRNLFCSILRNRGYQVLEARNGMEALQVLSQLKSLPSLVLLDLAMPVMGGDEVLPVLQEKFSSVKIVLCSGYAEEQARTKIASTAVSGFLQKPYTPEALLHKVEDVLSAALG
jgi:PAS domain S-box-containing protein